MGLKEYVETDNKEAIKEMKQKLYGDISQYAVSDNKQALIELSKSLVILGLTVYFEKSEYLLIRICSMIIRGFNYTRIFVMFHDMGHNSFFSQSQFNRLGGYLQILFLYFPFETWKNKHNYHHKTNSQTAPINLKEYLNLPNHIQLAYKILYSTPGLIIFIPFVYINMNLLDFIQFERTSFIIVVIGVYIKSHLTSFWFELVSLYIALACGMILFHVQHTFDDCLRKYNIDFFENGILGSSYFEIPAFFKFFSLGIEYHHIHHLNTRVPSYQLQKCHESIQQSDPNIWNDIPRVTLYDLFTKTQNVIYDEENQKLINVYELIQVEKKYKKVHQS